MDWSAFSMREGSYQVSTKVVQIFVKFVLIHKFGELPQFFSLKEPACIVTGGGGRNRIILDHLPPQLEVVVPYCTLSLRGFLPL